MKTMPSVRIVALLMVLALLLWPAAAPAQGGPLQLRLPNGMNAGFASAQGLPTPSPAVTFRSGESAIQMPGIARNGNVTLLQGRFLNDNRFWQWKSAIEMDTIARQTMVISSGNDQWVLKNAWPTRISGVFPQGGTVRVERLEIAYEQLVAGGQ